jgi:hypothetical protein
MIKGGRITKGKNLSNICNQDIEQKTKNINKSQTKTLHMDHKNRKVFVMDVVKYLSTSKLFNLLLLNI